MPTYYCHQCQQPKLSTEVLHENEGLVCSTCRSDFLEEIGNNNRRDLTGAMLPALFAPFAHFSEAFRGASGGVSDPQHQRPHQHQHQHRQAGARSLRDSPPASPPAFVFRFGENSADGLGLPLFHQIFGIRHLPFMDDAYSLDDVVTQLLNQLDNGGPPPATTQELQRITEVTINQQQVEQALQCFVCFDEFKLSEPVNRLPCQHHFHNKCIMPWLERHGTCPVCRKTLAGQDTSTQSFAEQQQSGAPDVGSDSSSSRRRQSTNDGLASASGGGEAGGSSSQQPYVEEEFD